MTPDLPPVSPLTPLELIALAALVRAKAENGPWVANRVSAALEAVAHYRESRSSAIAREVAKTRANNAAVAQRRVSASFTPKFKMARQRFVERARTRRTAGNARGDTLTDWSPIAICRALLAAERGQRLSRLQRDALAAQGWIEFVYERGHTAHRSGRPWLFTRLTAEGHNQLTLRLIALGM